MIYSYSYSFNPLINAIGSEREGGRTLGGEREREREREREAGGGKGINLDSGIHGFTSVIYHELSS